MTKHRLNDCTYALDPVFPGVFVAPGVGVAGWEGPQLIVPGDLSLDKSAAILLTDESKQSLERVLKSGYPKDKIYKMSDFWHISSRKISVHQYKDPNKNMFM